MKYAAFAVGLALGLTLAAGLRHLAHWAPTDAWPIERLEGGASPPAIPEDGSLPRNIIIFLADGLGFAHLTAAELVLGGIGARTVWDRFDAAGWTRSHPTSGLLTDSAASATAFATGSRTYYGGIGVDAAGAPKTTLFESAAALGYWTGIVTDSYVWDATPAAFFAHVGVRGDENAGEILRQLAGSRLELLAGELEDAGEGSVPGRAETVEMLQERFRVLGPGPESVDDLAGQRGPTVALYEEDQITDLRSSPDLPGLATAALERAAADGRPFLLLVESEEPDTASHARDFRRLLAGMEAIEAAVAQILEFADGRGDTLVVFTSDHETGGLALGGAGPTLQPLWATADHTGSAVPLLAYGPAAKVFVGPHPDWGVGRLLLQLVEAASERR